MNVDTFFFVISTIASITIAIWAIKSHNLANQIKIDSDNNKRELLKLTERIQKENNELKFQLIAASLFDFKSGVAGDLIKESQDQFEKHYEYVKNKFEKNKSG